MWFEDLNNYCVIAAAALELFSILLVWVYMCEAARGLDKDSYSSYRRHVNWLYVFFIVMLLLVWITSEGADRPILLSFWGAMIGWCFTAFAGLIVSLVISVPQENKRAMRIAIFPCLVKVVIAAAVLWLVY